MRSGVAGAPPHSEQEGLYQQLNQLKRFTAISRIVAKARAIDPAIDPADLSRRVSSVVGTQATQLANQMGGADRPWLTASLASVIALEMAQTIPQMGLENTLQYDWAGLFAPVTKLSLPIDHAPHHQQVEGSLALALSLQQAVARLGQAHRRHSMYHKDWQSIASWASRTLSGAVAGTLAAPGAQHWVKTHANRTALGQSLIRQAGDLLVDAWSRWAPELMGQVERSDDLLFRAEIARCGIHLAPIADAFNREWQKVGDHLQEVISSGQRVQQSLEVSHEQDSGPQLC